MSVTLMYTGEKEMVFQMTEKPITNPRQSPTPTGKHLDSLDPKRDQAEIDKLLDHPNYSESKTVVLTVGLNEFKNREHAEYIYKILGSPVIGGILPMGMGPGISIENKQVLIEVDKDGKEIRGKWFDLYRNRSGIVNGQLIDAHMYQERSKPQALPVEEKVEEKA